MVYELTPWHYKFTKDGSGYLFYGLFFPTLEALVERHQRDQGTLLAPLTRACTMG